ncbi:hypothetical protein NDU88_000959 [Pleurodeles waltl]|uniref:Uncharacterized protein n=1 Tax=Pleurodeles waltl TaxID=8319 RepID=A0AAV7VY25_PLEWA|nr:hypothetical protein NDU88_000959 [Pleurodeles waltl]
MQRRRDVRIERLLVPVPLSLRSCATLGHAPVALAIGRTPGERAVHSSHSVWYVRGRRASLLSLGQAGTAARVPAYSSPRLIREAQGAAGFLAPDRIGSGDPPYAAPLSHAVSRRFSGATNALAGLRYYG